MATVTLDKINKVYPNGFHAIHDLDLEIADTEFLVLVGPSGCGKSTALRMIAGLEEKLGVKLPMPLEGEEANTFLQALCKKHNVECKPPLTTARRSSPSSCRLRSICGMARVERRR